MKFSEAWLREWVDPGLERDDLLQQLTMAGLEVDGVDPVAGEFSGVVVGEVVSVDAHPDADKLRVCQVSNGSDTVQVVCGAPNVHAGMKTAFAQVGAVLPGNFKIKKAKLRGVESHGMLCSAKELEYGDDADGIMDLSVGAVGEDLTVALNTNDVIVDLDLTPNRGDCLSLKGIAREVGVLNNAQVTYPSISAVASTVDDTFPVSISHGEGCPRYLGRVIKGIDLSRPTPEWMQDRLRRCGLRSIDPVVDITNYVLIELGQPMHAFDLNQLNEQINVRLANAGEKLTLLDGQEVELDAETMLITDGNGPVAIAGVMGGERSGVQADTKDVFLECAFFAPLAVAGTARRYGLHTDASHRYERGVDYGLQFDAIERATSLLLDIVGGEPGPVVETLVEETLPKPNEVTLRHARLHELLGVEIDANQVDEALARLGLEVVAKADDAWTVRSPTHRFDIAIEADLVEEVCRVYGYNNIPFKSPTTSLELRSVELEASPEAELKRFMASLGLQEVITYTFVDPAMQDLMDPTREPVALANPMSSEQSVMRTNMLPGLVDALQNNQARQQDRIRLFELGLVFQPADGALDQPQRLGGLIWGRRQEEAWHSDGEKVDFFDLKGLVDALFSWAGLEVSYEASEESVLHPGQRANVVVDGEVVGYLGRLHPEIESRLDLEGAYVFELDGACVQARSRRSFAGVSRFPSVRRDIAVLVPSNVSAADIENSARSAAGELLVEFRLFDVYAGKGIDSNEKSVAIGLTFQSQTATLTDDEVNESATAVLSALTEAHGARQR